MATHVEQKGKDRQLMLSSIFVEPMSPTIHAPSPLARAFALVPCSSFLVLGFLGCTQQTFVFE